MLAFSEAVLLIAFVSGLPSTLSTGIKKGKLPEQFIGIFRNDHDKENHRRTMSSVIELPRSTAEAEDNSIHFQQMEPHTYLVPDAAYTNYYAYCFSFNREKYESFLSSSPCLSFKLGESYQENRNGTKIGILFYLTDDPTVLKARITQAQKGILHMQFTFSEKGVEFQASYRNHSDQETITNKTFYRRTMQPYMRGMFEIDTELVTQETIDKANSIFRPINHGGSFSFSVDTRLWVREPYEGVFVYVTLFSAAYQWSNSFALFENETFYYNVFNGTTEARRLLGNSTPVESVLLSQMSSVDGRFNLTTRTVFKRDTVEQILTFNGEQLTLHYRRIVEDLLYGSYEELTVPGKEGISASLNMAPGTEPRSRLKISRSAARQYSLDITPGEDVDRLHIPFMLKDETEFTSVRQNNGTATAYFHLSEWGVLQARLRFRGRRPEGVLFWISQDAANDRTLEAMSGISLTVADYDGFPFPQNFRSYKLRRLFPKHMFGSFDSTNDTTDTTKSVLEFSQNDNGSFVAKLSEGRKKPTTTTFVGSTWTNVDTGKSGEYFYFEFAGDGVPAILRLLWEDEYPYRFVLGETMIFNPDGVEIHTTLAVENTHTKRFYSRRPIVKS